ncbi:hypothetical protein TELCIR_07117 [Teladorsagia circumcincta]|uniref:Acyl-CoA oxidase C-alpha1 domain-containing protein n=1 Tax=Teladorsagia circumcincta TaxID=45464 RepID=A0A2G9UL62_TELCI|nr:hypothetical protein TELCIR_07117 [Teladorsagia circumcincta]
MLLVDVACVDTPLFAKHHEKVHVSFGHIFKNTFVDFGDLDLIDVTLQKKMEDMTNKQLGRSTSHGFLLHDGVSTSMASSLDEYRNRATTKWQELKEVVEGEDNVRIKKHRAPLWTLLNKGCDVTATGKYVSSYKTSAERQSVSLGALSIGRIGIIGKGVIASGLASTIAIRYSACRRQFGRTKGDELPVIEYPLQQHRLFPYLAGHYAIRLFHKKLMEHFTDYIIRMMQNEKSEEMMEFSREIHALSAVAKPVSTWFGVEALGEARRACGGHG